MNAKINPVLLWQKIPFKTYIYISITVNVLVVLLVVFTRNWMPPVVPLFYGKPSGEGQLVPTLGLLIAPAASLLITLLNTALSVVTNDTFFKQVLIATTLLITLLTTITVLKVIFLVGFF